VVFLFGEERGSHAGRAGAERWHSRKNVLRLWAGVVVMPLLDRAGNLRGFAKVMRGFTERKQAEEALHQSEERFRLLVQCSSDVITVIDAEGTIRYVSPAVERAQGYRPQELVGKSALTTCTRTSSRRRRIFSLTSGRDPASTRLSSSRCSQGWFLPPLRIPRQQSAGRSKGEGRGY